MNGTESRRTSAGRDNGFWMGGAPGKAVVLATDSQGHTHGYAWARQVVNLLKRIETADSSSGQSINSR